MLSLNGVKYTVDCAVASAEINSLPDRPTSPLHSIQNRPAHSGALFNRLPVTSPVTPLFETAI